MNTFKTANILCITSTEAVIQSLKENTTNGWQHDPTETRINADSIGSVRYIAFQCTRQNDRVHSGLFCTIESNSITLSNIVPREESISSLGYDQYNLVLESFIEDVGKVGEREGFFQILHSSDKVDLESELGSEVFKKLKLFSNCANKSTGSAHPLDEERWFDFIISSFDSEAVLDESTIGRWLREVGGWDKDSAIALQMEYRSAVDLLRYYKRRGRQVV